MILGRVVLFESMRCGGVIPTRNLSQGPDQVDPNQLFGLYKV